MAKHPKLLSGVAVFLLRQATAKEERAMRSLSPITLGIAAAMMAVAGTAAAQQKEVMIGG